jgi:hypothetical protein
VFHKVDCERRKSGGREVPGDLQKLTGHPVRQYRSVHFPARYMSHAATRPVALLERWWDYRVAIRTAFFFETMLSSDGSALWVTCRYGRNAILNL